MIWKSFVKLINQFRKAADIRDIIFVVRQNQSNSIKGQLFIFVLTITILRDVIESLEILKYIHFMYHVTSSVYILIEKFQTVYYFDKSILYSLITLELFTYIDDTDIYLG